MVGRVGGGRPLGLFGQPEEFERHLSRTLHDSRIHPVVPDVQEADLGSGPGKLDPDPGRIGTVSQGGDVDDRDFAGVDWFGSRRGGHGRNSSVFGVGTGE